MIVTYDPQWPEQWSDQERDRFRMQCINEGLVSYDDPGVESKIIVFAHELYKVQASLSDFREYMDEMKTLPEAMYRLTVAEDRWIGSVEWFLFWLTGLSEPGSSTLMNALKILFLGLLFMPYMLVMYLYIKPMRWYFEMRGKRLKRKITPLFRQWLVDKGRLDQAEKTRLEQEALAHMMAKDDESSDEYRPAHPLDQS